MNKIYDARLREMLDELYLKTTVSIPWSTIYIWFETQKIAKTPYRHIQKEWDEVCECHQSVWPERTTPVELSVVKKAGFDGLVIRRELFDDEELISFSGLTQ